MLKRIAATGLVVTLCCATAGVARATPLTYTLSGVTITQNTDSNNGLNILTAVNQTLPYNVGTLNDGQSAVFSLFDIWTDESARNSDDTTPRPFTVALTFSQPPPGGSGGSTGGNTVEVGSIIQMGRLTWDSTNPFTVTAGGVSYSVLLTDNANGTPHGTADFNGGLFSLNPGRQNGATIYAKVTQISSNVQGVPEPASFVLFGVSGLCLAGFRKLRRGKVAV